MTSNSIKAYLKLLKKELANSDRATIQDALADAEEHLTTALTAQQENNPELSEAESLKQIIEEYGSPKEIAEAYRNIEAYLHPDFASSQYSGDKGLLAVFFGILADSRAWGALLYMFIAFLTGVIYLSWALVGLSTSLAFALFIFGLPFALLFLLSVRGIALLEGRIVEGLLGVRMPRRPVFESQSSSWRERLKNIFLSWYTWRIVLYMCLQFLFGTLYFLVFVTLITSSLSFLAIPILELGFALPMVVNGPFEYHIPVALMPLSVILGLFLSAVSMHFAKFVGRLHGAYAKKMLVSN